MNRVIEYIVVYEEKEAGSGKDDERTSFVSLVEDWIGQGYQPWGSMCATVDKDGIVEYHQAMVKYEEE